MKYIIGGAGVVLILAIFIGIIFAVVNRTEEQQESIEPGITLTEAVDQESRVEFTTYGRIIADEEFRAIRFKIDQQRRVMEVLHGYNLTIEERYELPNTAASYEAFLSALQNEGFLATQASHYDSEQGLCSNGKRYVYELFMDSQSEQRTWSTSCRSTRGTFSGQQRAVERLFQAQIPDYRDLTRSVKL